MRASDLLGDGREEMVRDIERLRHEFELAVSPTLRLASSPAHDSPRVARSVCKLWLRNSPFYARGISLHREPLSWSVGRSLARTAGAASERAELERPEETEGEVFLVVESVRCLENSDLIFMNRARAHARPDILSNKDCSRRRDGDDTYDR